MLRLSRRNQNRNPVKQPAFCGTYGYGPGTDKPAPSRGIYSCKSADTVSCLSKKVTLAEQVSIFTVEIIPILTMFLISI